MGYHFTGDCCFSESVLICNRWGIHDLDSVGTNCKFFWQLWICLCKFCSLESTSPVPYGLLSKSSWQVMVKGTWGGKGLIT